MTTPDELDALASILRLLDVHDSDIDTVWVPVENFRMAVRCVQMLAARLRAEATPADPRGSGSGGADDDDRAEYEELQELRAAVQGHAAALAQARREALNEAALSYAHCLESDCAECEDVRMWLRARAAEEEPR